MQTQIGKDIQHACQLLENTALVAIPTETVYGLAANALDIKAVINIFETKQRPSFDPLIIHTHSIDQAKDYVLEIPDQIYQLAAAFSPGPLTFLLPKSPLIPDIVTSSLPNVAVRIPNHPLTLALLSQLDFPLAAPSANPFGYVSPTTPNHVLDQLGGKIPYILDGGVCQVGIESTIVGMENGQLVIYRLGGTSVESIAEAIHAQPQVKPHSSSNPKAPGMLKSHYAPEIPLHIGGLEAILKRYPLSQIASICFGEYTEKIPTEQQYNLSLNADMSEAAQRLFAILREIDQSTYKVIYTELLPAHGLGKAINDRLKRASI